MQVEIHLKGAGRPPRPLAASATHLEHQLDRLERWVRRHRIVMYQRGTSTPQTIMAEENIRKYSNIWEKIRKYMLYMNLRNSIDLYAFWVWSCILGGSTCKVPADPTFHPHCKCKWSKTWRWWTGKVSSMILWCKYPSINHAMHNCLSEHVCQQIMLCMAMIGTK